METISLETAIEKVLLSPNVVCRKPLYETYDKNVQGNTAYERGFAACSMTTCFRDFPELPEAKKHTAVAISGGGNPNLAKIDPHMTAENAVMEALLLQACVGAVPLAATDCLNFGNPEKEDQMGELVAGIEGVKKACETLNTPIVSGNVSLYNESAGQSIPPSAIISVFGRVDHLEKVKPLAIPATELTLYCLGKRSKNLGGSEFLRLFEKQDSNIPTIEYEAFKKLTKNLQTAIDQTLFASITPIQRGGLITALLTSTFPHEIGVDINIPTEASVPHFCFTEDLGVLVSTDKPDEVEKLFGTEALKIGTTNPTVHKGMIKQGHKILFEKKLADWKTLWENNLRTIF